MRKKLLGIFVILLLTLPSIADNVKITAKASPKAGIGQTFQVQYTLNEKPSEIKLGNFDSSIKLVSGPNLSTSQNISIVNGNYTQENSYTYTYYFQASQTGTYTFEGATAKVSGKEYTANSVSVQIQEEAVQSGNRRNNNNYYDPWQDFYNMMGYGNENNNNNNTQPQEITGDDLFIKVYVDKTDLYKGEGIIATIKIYTKVDLMGFEDIQLPQFDDFYAEEIETPDRINLIKENYNNQTYNVGVIKKYILYPRVAGDISIEPCEITCQIRQIVGSGFYRYYDNTSKTVRSSEIKINVKNLPQPPKGFNGAVGNFNLNVDISEDTVLVNDAVVVNVKVSGKGNFNMIETPNINWPKEFEVYEPIASQNISYSANGSNGYKSWEYTIIPRYPGIFNLGKFNFTYFDSNSKQYKTIESKDIRIAVKKDESDTSFGENSYTYTQKNVEFISEDDILFVKFEDLNLQKGYLPVIKRWYFPWLYILPFVFFFILIIILRKKIKENANIANVKQRKAGKTSQKRLKKARKYMSKGQKSEFYKEIISALWGYCSDKLSIPIAELTKDKISDVLTNSKIDSSLTDKLIEVIDKCEFAHFAPESPEMELSYIYKEASDIIESLEQNIK